MLKIFIKIHKNTLFLSNYNKFSVLQNAGPIILVKHCLKHLLTIK